MEFKEGSVMQVAYVVRDLEAAMKRHREVCEHRPLGIYTSRPRRCRTTSIAASRRPTPA